MPGVTRTPDSGIAVLERQPYWAPELQRQFAGELVAVRACRATADLDAVLPAWTRAVCVLELEHAPGACLTWLGRLRESGRDVAVIVCGSPATTSLEWTVRELGALAFFPDLPTGTEVAQLCRRLLHKPS